jgi:non-homologous end joining protein Ku
MTQPLDLGKFKDDYREQLESIIEQKKRGKKTVEVSDEEDVEPAPRSMNLMEALKRSLEHHAAHKATREHGHRKSA